MQKNKIMNEKEIRNIIFDIQASPKECEWVEVKGNNYAPELIGEYISALANGAAYMGQSKGYLVFGIQDGTHTIIGTTYQPKQEKIGNEEIENWLATQLSPRIDFLIQETTVNDKRIVLFIIDSAGNTPVKFKGTAWIRVGSIKKKLADHPERERKIWQNTKNSYFETKIALAGISADEVLTVIDYPSVFRLLKIPYPENKAGILEKLAEEKIIYHRAASYEMEITNPGKPLIDTNRFIDHAPLSRNEVLASIMRRMELCEERGTGVDRAITDCELYQLPAPDFVGYEDFARVTMSAAKPLKMMSREEKIRACYQHCCMQYVSGNRMTNESLRKRLDIEDHNYTMASKIIADTLTENLIKLDDNSKSRRFIQYLPLWN